MAGVPAVSTSFGDLLDPLFEEIFNDALEGHPDMLPELYDMVGTNGRADMKWSEIGAFDDFAEFTGDVQYQSPFQGYDVTAVPIEFASGFQVERKLFDDDQWNVMNERPRGLADAAHRTRQRHGSRIFGNAFSVDTYFSTNTEAVALCSTAHTTTTGASTAAGFSNKGTSAFSATALETARINMKRFRGDQAQRIETMPDEIWFPPELYGRVDEVLSSSQKTKTADNDINIHQGVYTPHEWTYMDDANDWFVGDTARRRRYLKWTDRIALEFAMAEDIDTIVAKWRAYMRYAGAIWLNWRFIYGHEVS